MSGIMANDWKHALPVPGMNCSINIACVAMTNEEQLQTSISMLQSSEFCKASYEPLILVRFATAQTETVYLI